jgi:hypothetical protein
MQASRGNESPGRKILLESEQQELLTILVEAARNVQREQRQKFMFVETFGASTIDHPGLSNGSVEAYKGDIEILGRKGLISLSYVERGVLSFDVTPEGFKYYEDMKKHVGKPLQRVEQTVKNFLTADRFQQRYSTAYQKWAQAEAMLWASESESQYTTIGHLCREALQEFASTLVAQYQLPADEKDKALTVARLKSVISLRAGQLGKTEKELLDALVSYWGTLSDLIQRQEHGGQKEGEPLIWEDERRVVFQTAIVMFEVDRSLSRNQ